MKKHYRKSTQTKFWKRAWAICNFHMCYNFALLLHVNAIIVFNQSETCNFSCTLLGQKKGNDIFIWPHQWCFVFLAFFYLVKGHSMTRRNQVPVKCAGCNEKVVKSYRCVMRTEAPSHIKPLFALQPGEMLRICRKCVKKKEIGNGKSSSWSR